MKTLEEAVLYSDGGARGNPGPAGIGVVISLPSGAVLKEFKAFIGNATNNQAEYNALIKGLELAKALQVENVRCVMDSELLVKQLTGEYRVRNPNLKPLFQRVQALERNFKKVYYCHAPRENTNIKIADRLVNEAIDKEVKGL